MDRLRPRVVQWLLAAGLALSVGGCKVLTLEEDALARAQQSGNFDVNDYVSTLWPQQVQPYLDGHNIDVAQLQTALASMPIDTLGGRQAGEGSPWTFITSGSGIISQLDNTSRQGLANIKLDNGNSVALLIGPVIFSSSIRDALPFISFNDFANQIVFADVGNSLTAYALTANQTTLAALKPGDRIDFQGVFAIYDAGDAIKITPTAIKVQ